MAMAPFGIANSTDGIPYALPVTQVKIDGMYEYKGNVYRPVKMVTNKISGQQDSEHVLYECVGYNDRMQFTREKEEFLRLFKPITRAAAWKLLGGYHNSNVYMDLDQLNKF